MLEPVQSSSQNSMLSWDMFAKSGDPKMYLNYKKSRGKVGDKGESLHSKF